MSERRHPGGWIGWWFLAGAAIAATGLPAMLLAGPGVGTFLTLLPIPAYFTFASLLGSGNRSAEGWVRSTAPHVLVSYYMLLLVAGFASIWLG